MKRKQFVSALFLAAATLALNACDKEGSVGGSQSGSETPTAKGGPVAGSGETSKAAEGLGSGLAQANKDTPVGGSQSERTGSGAATPLPEGSPSAGSTDPSKAGSAESAQANKDTSVGGSQSERTGSGANTPLPEGSRSAGSGDPSKAGQGARSASQSQGMGGQQDVRQVQEALKNQGQNPGPIDGIMGPRTRQALRAFQGENALKQTGTLDAETKQKLNIEGSSSGSSAGPATGSGSIGRDDSSTKQKESSSPMGK